MLAPSWAPRIFPSVGRSALQRLLPTATPVFSAGTVCRGCITQPQCFLWLWFFPARDHLITFPILEPHQSPSSQCFSLPILLSLQLRKGFLLALQWRWALLYLPCQDHSSPLAQLSSQCCPGEVLSSPRYS